MRWGQTLSSNHEKLFHSLQDISDSWRLQVDLKSFLLRMEHKGPLQPLPRRRVVMVSGKRLFSGPQLKVHSRLSRPSSLPWARTPLGTAWNYTQINTQCNLQAIPPQWAGRCPWDMEGKYWSQLHQRHCCSFPLGTWAKISRLEMSEMSLFGGKGMM